MQITKQLLPEDQRKPRPTDESALGFGKIFTDHMFMAEYNPERGWHEPRIVPYQQLVLDPAALVLHYGQAVFEGLKAYRGEDGSIYLFRPMDNVRRMNRSARRLCIPEVPEQLLLEGMMELVRVDKEWVPASEGTSLYIRPVIIATEAFLGVKVSSRYLLYVIVGPVGAYYAEGFNPVRIYVEEEFVRAVAGGLGEAKTPANYAASLLAAQLAHARGFTQVLWLDACDKKGVEEVGTMNIFFKIAGEVITPELSGSILPGITRDSVITLCRHWGLKVTERRITIDEVIEACAAGTLEEVFGTGTAAVISPVGSIHYRGKDYQVADGNTGELAKRLYEEITGIQYGRLADPFGWRVKVC